jgi:hypothetical protein
MDLEVMYARGLATGVGAFSSLLRDPSKVPSPIALQTPIIEQCEPVAYWFTGPTPW